MTHAPDLSRRPRTRRVFSGDDMARMAQLYYDPGVPMTQVGDAFGVPVSTFLRWIAEMDWPRRTARWTPPAPAPASPPASPPTCPPLAAPAPEPARPGARGRKPRQTRPLPKPPRIGKISGVEAPEALIAFAEGCEIARRELSALAAEPPRTLAERERVARLVASLSASLLRLQRGYDRESELFATEIVKRRRGL